jgi:cytoskeletal protein RodZ
MPVALRQLPTTKAARIVPGRAVKSSNAPKVLAASASLVGPALAASAAIAAQDLSNVASSAANVTQRTAPEVADAVSRVDLTNVNDTSPLIGGLAVGVVIAGVGLAAVSGGLGAKVTTKRTFTSDCIHV